MWLEFFLCLYLFLSLESLHAKTALSLIWPEIAMHRRKVHPWDGDRHCDYGSVVVFVSLTALLLQRFCFFGYPLLLQRMSWSKRIEAFLCPRWKEMVPAD